MVIRMMPYPPSFSSRAARSIEPAMGASTWALGSHRCKPYRGALTMKAIRRAKLDIMPVQDNEVGGCESFSIGRYRVPIWFCRVKIATSRGSELASV